MDLMAMRRWGGVFLAVLAWCLWPVQVQAQAYPCPGPGPGERMVGMTAPLHPLRNGEDMR